MALSNRKNPKEVEYASSEHASNSRVLEVEYASPDHASNRPSERLMSRDEVAKLSLQKKKTKGDGEETKDDGEKTTKNSSHEGKVMDVEYASHSTPSSSSSPPRIPSGAIAAGTKKSGEDGDDGSDKENLSFRKKVEEILERSESDSTVAQIISWDSDCKSFQVHNETEFETIIMPSYFEEEEDGLFKTFARKLMSHGFERENEKPNCYRHPDVFRRNHHQDQCHQITSPETKQDEKKPAVENDEEKSNDDVMNSKMPTSKPSASSSRNKSNKNKKSKKKPAGSNDDDKLNDGAVGNDETNAEVATLKADASARKKKTAGKKKAAVKIIGVDDDNTELNSEVPISKKKAAVKTIDVDDDNNEINSEVRIIKKAAGTHNNRSTGSTKSQNKDDVGGTEDIQKLPFPVKLWEMLNDAEDRGWTESVSWTDDGMGLRIQDTVQFSNVIVPAYFKNPLKFKSVVRYLEMHGFKKEDGVYGHPLFTRESRERCQDITNLKQKKKKKREEKEKKPIPRPRKRAARSSPNGAGDVTVTMRKVGKSRYETVGVHSPSSTPRPQRRAKEAGRTSVRLTLAEEAKGPGEFTDSDDGELDAKWDMDGSRAYVVGDEDEDFGSMGRIARRGNKEAAFTRSTEQNHIQPSPRGVQGGLVMSVPARQGANVESRSTKKPVSKKRRSNAELPKRRKKKRDEEERREDSASEKLPRKRGGRSTSVVNYNDDGETDQVVIELDSESLPDGPVQEPFEVLDDPNEYYIEEEAHLYHNPPLPSKKTVGVMPKDLKPIPPPPPLSSNFPNTGECTWHYDEETRVLLAKFNSSSMHKDDEKFFLRMLERDDITVVSEGLADFSKLDANLWDRAYWSTVMGHEFFHKFRRFDMIKKGDEEAKCVEVDTLYSMRMLDYMKYLCRRNKFLEENPDYDFRDDGKPDDRRISENRRTAGPEVADDDSEKKPGAVDDDDKMAGDKASDRKVLDDSKEGSCNGLDSSTHQDLDPYSLGADTAKLSPSSDDNEKRPRAAADKKDGDKASGPMVLDDGSTEGPDNGLAGSTREDPEASRDEPIEKSNALAEPMALDDDTDGPNFTFRDHENRLHSIHVGRSCLYMIDLDVNRYLPSVYSNFLESFGCHKILPGGEHCMMNSITSNARPFMGPNVYITPPAAFTHFHQDGHGTVDSGHLVITGYNEVVMIRRLTERHKKHALWLLTGDRSSEKSSAPAFFDGLYSEPHGDGLGEKPSWPTYDRIDACKKMGYCPSVLILKPSQLVHINKGRLHAFRKMATTKLPETDCHSKMRANLVEERRLKGEILCVSVAWDWMFRGATTAGINREVCTVLEATILNRKKARVSLAIPETSLLQMATKFVPINRKMLPRQDYCSFIQNYSNEIESEDQRDPDESAKIEKCRGILPGLRYVSKQHIHAMESAVNKSRLMGKGERVTVMSKPNTQENPLQFPVDPYGNSDFFCKLCQKELSNVYYHCDGCETLLSKDFNICRECHAEKKSMRLIHIHPLNPKRHSLVNHLGDPNFDRFSRCPCKNGPVCKHCGYCGGCSCRCHTWFTLHSRFFSKDGEAALVQRVEDAVAAHKNDDCDSNVYFNRYLKEPGFVEDRFARAEKDYES